MRNNIRVKFNLIVLLAILLAVECLASDGFTQSLENGWKGIRPLSSRKVDVEKILGRPISVDKDNFYRYETADAQFRINYSIEPCTKADFGRGDFSVLPDTVLDYSMWMKNLIKLSSLEFDRAKFYKDTSGDVVGRWIYYDRDYDVIISGATKAETQIEYVGTIWFKPSKSEAEKLNCTKN